jgi:hypothetical protein
MPASSPAYAQPGCAGTNAGVASLEACSTYPFSVHPDR